MAYYNANEIIRLTRRALGITQEELCDGICDVSTLSKIENGHYGVKRDTYRELMRKMGRVAEMRYTVCLEQDGRLLEDRIEFERAFKKYDYEVAEKYVKRMKENADDNILTQQYIARAEALVDYYRKRISAEELAERIDRAIHMTVPEYEKYLSNKERVFPFVNEELLALMSLGNVYRKLGQGERGMQMYEAICRCLQADYMSVQDKISQQISVEYSIAMAYAAEGRHLEALGKKEKCIQLCKNRDYSYSLASLLFSKAHSYVRLVERGEWGKEKLDEAKNILRQSYCLATARREEELKKTIIKYCEQHFGEWH